jgi:hypothetical protein
VLVRRLHRARIRMWGVLVCAKMNGERGRRLKISKREGCGGGYTVNNLCDFLLKFGGTIYNEFWG